MNLKNGPFSTEKNVKLVILIISLVASVYAGLKLWEWIIEYSLGKFMG